MRNTSILLCEPMKMKTWGGQSWGNVKQLRKKEHHTKWRITVSNRFSTKFPYRNFSIESYGNTFTAVAENSQVQFTFCCIKVLC